MQSSVPDMTCKGMKKRGYHRNCCTPSDTTRSLSDYPEQKSPGISGYFLSECSRVFYPVKEGKLIDDEHGKGSLCLIDRSAAARYWWRSSEPAGSG